MTTADDSATGRTLTATEPDAAGGQPGPAFDALCRIVRSLFDVAAASISVAGVDRAAFDLAPDEDPADWGFADCPSAIPDGLGAAFAIEDAASHPATLDRPWVTGAPRLRFLTAVAFEGGRIALFDTRRGSLSPTERRQLDDLAIVAAGLSRLDRQARQAAAERDEFRLLADTSTDTIVRGTLDGIRLYISPAVRDLLGYEPQELVGARAIEITHPDDVPEFRGLMQQIRDGELSVGRTEQRQRHKDGSWVWLEAHIRLTHDPRTGQPDGYVASVRGIGARKAIEARLEHLATHDELTGLPNRKLFRDRLVAATAEARLNGKRFALLWMDLDRFKAINDGLGHQVGDAVLCEAARRFRSVARPGDMIARLGGDEFVLIGGIERDGVEAADLATRLIATMAAPFTFAGHTIEAGLSIGIACAPDCGLDPDDLLGAADMALYQAKSAGRGTFRFCEPSTSPG